LIAAKGSGGVCLEATDEAKRETAFVRGSGGLSYEPRTLQSRNGICAKLFRLPVSLVSRSRSINQMAVSCSIVPVVPSSPFRWRDLGACFPSFHVHRHDN
jgi:hypothetical protein